MKLLSIYNLLIAENKVSSFPKYNFSLSYFEDSRKIQLTPLDNSKLSKTRSVANQIQNYYKVKSVKMLPKDVVEIQFHPGDQDFWNAIDFVQDESDHMEL